MTKVSQQQALDRWDTLPPKIREALISESNADFLWRTAESEHIPKEKLNDVARIAGYVLLGFIHAGDLAQELKESLGINQEVTNPLANAINERIFAPLQADLEKIYEPPSALAPKPVVEIKPFDSTPASAETSAGRQGRPTAPSQTGTAPSPAANIVGGLKPFEIKLTEASSSSKPIGDIKPFSVIQGRPPAPTSPQPTTTPLPFKIGVPLAPSRIEGSAPSFSKLETKPPVVSTSAPLSTGQAEPPPTMLHEEPLSPSSKFTQGFKIDIPQPRLSEIKPRIDTPMRPAVLELGEMKPSTPNKMGAPAGNEFDKFITNRVEQRKPGEENARVVHYSEFKTPLDKSTDKVPVPPVQKVSPAPSFAKASEVKEPEREIKEITGAAPVFNTSAPSGVNRVETPKAGIPAWAKPPETSRVESPPVPAPSFLKPQMPTPVTARVEPPPVIPKPAGQTVNEIKPPSPQPRIAPPSVPKPTPLAPPPAPIKQPGLRGGFVMGGGPDQGGGYMEPPAMKRVEPLPPRKPEPPQPPPPPPAK